MIKTLQNNEIILWGDNLIKKLNNKETQLWGNYTQGECIMKKLHRKLYCETILWKNIMMRRMNHELIKMMK